MNPPKLLLLTLLSTLSLSTVAHAEDLEQTQRLVTTGQCPRCDLSGIGLVFADLSGAELSGADLSAANLNRANLSDANLSEANLSRAVLFNANLSGANLRGADLRGADLREAYFTGADLEGALLDGANLVGAVGLPTTVATPEQIYMWGLTESQRGNYRGAIAYFNQVLTMKPDFAHAVLARGVARYQMRDLNGALEDAKQAETLYLEQGNEQGHQASMQFEQGLVAMQEAIAQGDRRAARGGGGNFLNFLGSLSGLLLQFLPF
jgi:uncharacterized protein YjbI with pentapeptide repeats